MDSEGDGRLSLKESIAKVYSTKPNRKYEGIVKHFLEVFCRNPNSYSLPMMSDSIATMTSQLHTKHTTLFDMGHDRFVLIYEIAFQVFYFNGYYDRNRMAELFTFYIEEFKTFYVFVAVDHFFNGSLDGIVDAAKAGDLKKLGDIINRIDLVMGVYLHVVKADISVFQRCLISRLTEMKDKKLAATIIHAMKQIVNGFINLVLQHELEAFVNEILYDPESYSHFDEVKIKNSLDEICSFIGVEYKVLGKVVVAMIMIYINKLKNGNAIELYLFFKRFYGVQDEKVDVSDLFGQSESFVVNKVVSREANRVYGKVYTSTGNGKNSDVSSLDLKTISDEIMDAAYAFYVFLRVDPRAFLAWIATIVMDNVVSPGRLHCYCTTLDSSVSLLKGIKTGDDNKRYSIKLLVTSSTFSNYILGQKRITGTE